MQDLFGMELAEPEKKIIFSEMEVAKIYVEVIGEGELLNDLAANLEKLQSLDPKDQSMGSIRKTAWADLIWVYGVDEPSPISFDSACDVCGADAECIRAGISKAFGDEIRLMCNLLSARLPHLKEKIHRMIGKYVDLRQMH